MDSRWSDQDAREAVARYAEQGIGEDLALRTYTTRLLGGDPALVLHGGGNTSVKTTAADLTGETVDVICVKGSGWDMGTIEPPGLPAVRLAPLHRLRALDHLSDEDMVNAQRVNLLDSGAPTPSVETLLHAFLPHKFVDHTHANAVLALTDQPDGAELAREVYGDRVALVPYVMPGFGLAKATGDVFDANPGVEGLVLLKHGIFSMGESAEEAYERMIDLVSLAEARLATGRRTVFVPAALPPSLATPEQIAPILRGAVALQQDEPGAWRRWVADFRTSKAILNFAGGEEVGRYSQAGTVTPDHVIRTKAWPMIVPPPEPDALDDFAEEVRHAVAEYHAAYHAYFDRNNERLGGTRTELDPAPRLILVPGVGLFALGKSAKDAAIAGDIAEAMVDVVTDAEAIGTLRAGARGRPVRRRILVAGTGQARQGHRAAAGAPGRPGHRRRQRHRCGHRQGLRRGRRRGCRARPRR